MDDNMSDKGKLFGGGLDKPKIAGILLIIVFVLAVVGAGEVFLFDWDAVEIDPLPEEDPRFELDERYEEYLVEGEIDRALLDALNENITAEDPEGEEISENANLTEGDDIWWVEEDGEKIYGIEQNGELEVYAIEDIDEGLVETILNMCGVIYVVIGAVVLVGAICAIKKVYRKVALVSSVIGLFSIGIYFLGSIFSVIALVMIWTSKEEFES